MKNEMDLKNKRLLTAKELREYTGMGPQTMALFGDAHACRRKIGGRWMFDRVKVDQVLNKLFKVKE